MISWRERLTGQNPGLFNRCFRYLLRLACLWYWCVVVIRNWLYDRGILRAYRSPVPVISIGNLSVGGTGKTPAVAWIVRWLQQEGLRVVVLSRGYGKLASGQNDEALELELKMPGLVHLQNKDRSALARRAVQEFNAQVIVLDDGFQHRRLARDLDIVLLDATDSRWAQWILPAGLRREPFSSIRRAHVVLITRSDQVDSAVIKKLEEEIRQQNPTVVCARTEHRATSLFQFPDCQIPLESLHNSQVFAFCGIGNPESFLRSLKAHGAHIAGQRIWPDHHDYSTQDIDWLREKSNQFPSTKMICTMKDWVKIRQSALGTCPLLAMQIDLEFAGGDHALTNLLINVIRKHTSETES